MGKEQGMSYMLGMRTEALDELDHEVARSLSLDFAILGSY